MKLSVFLLFIFIWIFSSSMAQIIKPGYDKSELIEMLKINARIGEEDYYSDSLYIEPPDHFQFVYRSPEMGLLNRWELWVGMDPVAVISIRGTVPQTDSWLNNFYAAMVPARGKMMIGATDTFRYELAVNPRAAVHVGWLMSTAFLSRDILPKIDSLYQEGIKQFFITGHSQGGGISYLLTAYLYNLREKGHIPADIRFKTYSTAAPKPGNLYFAYEYEVNRKDMAFNVVNTLDWVPEVPISIQTLEDFNDVNPFIHARATIKKNKFPRNLVMRHVYNKLEKPAEKARDNYEKYLGEMLAKEIQKKIEGFHVDSYYPSNHYVRTGETHILTPDESYIKRFPENEGNFFIHHLHHPYLFLLDRTVLENPEESAKE